MAHASTFPAPFNARREPLDGQRIAANAGTIVINAGLILLLLVPLANHLEAEGIGEDGPEGERAGDHGRGGNDARAFVLGEGLELLAGGSVLGLEAGPARVGRGRELPPARDPARRGLAPLGPLALAATHRGPP